MSKAKIFLVGETEKVLVPMEETPYAAEDILQGLLEDYPDLVPGDQINPDYPRKWLLIKREAGVPSCQDGSDNWSLDHLFVDQDGIPTFIECKRATDTRIRREVVAQMLDYAANGTIYWSVDRLRQDAAETARLQQKDLDELVADLVGSREEDALDQYWKTVEKNLKEGKIRLVFVADEIPRELQRLIEFMNDKMSDIEVIGVEVKQYLGGERRAVVPRLIGLTEKARQKKEGGSTTPTNQTKFLASLPSESRDFFEKLFGIAQQRNLIVSWGKQGFSLRIKFASNSKVTSFAYGWPNGHFNFYFEYIDVSQEELAALRKELMNFGVFNESGKYTLDAFIDQANQDKALEMFVFIANRMEQLAGN